jgi:hypothetical protein
MRRKHLGKTSRGRFYAVAYVELSEGGGGTLPFAVGTAQTQLQAMDLARCRAADAACGEHGGGYCDESGHHLYVAPATEAYWRGFAREPGRLVRRRDRMVATCAELEAEDPGLVREYVEARRRIFSEEGARLFDGLVSNYQREISLRTIELTIDDILASELLRPGSITGSDRLTGHQTMSIARLRAAHPEAFAKRFIESALKLEALRASPLLEFHEQASKNDEFLLNELARIAVLKAPSPEATLDTGYVPLCQTLMRGEAEREFRQRYECYREAPPSSG